MSMVCAAFAGAHGNLEVEMLDWYIHEAQMRHEERLHEISHDALVREALSSKPERPGLADRALVEIGRRMVEWGRDLQARHGLTYTPPKVDTAGFHPRSEPTEIIWSARGRRDLN